MKFDASVNSKQDWSGLAERFRRNGHVRIFQFLGGDTAQRLHDKLRARQDWLQVLNSGDKLVELDRPTRGQLQEDQRKALDDAVYGSARYGFQYRYETIRVPDEPAARKASDDFLGQFATWFSSRDILTKLKTVIGIDAIDFADMQATAYEPGDFLTGHDDNVAGKNRHAAYVLSLNPVWRPEWGGLLLRHLDEFTVEGDVPAFNTLDIFRVGLVHSVSEVSRAAPNRRYSITGWLRSASGGEAQ